MSHTDRYILFPYSRHFYFQWQHFRVPDHPAMTVAQLYSPLRPYIHHVGKNINNICAVLFHARLLPCTSAENVILPGTVKLNHFTMEGLITAYLLNKNHATII